MAIRSIVKKISAPIPVISVCSILLFALCFLIVKSLSDDASGNLQFWITLLGSLGIAILVFFLFTNCYTLFRQFRRNEIGSKLTAKLVVIFLFLTVIPFSLIYFFSIQFLNKGVDSWFDVRIEQTVKDSLLLSKTALEGIKEELTADVEEYAKSIRQKITAGELLRTLDDIRELEGYSELSLYSDDGRIVAFSSADASKILPDTPGDEVFTELRLNQTYTLLEPISESTLQFRIVTPIRVNELGREFFGLQAIKILPLRYATLTESVEKANSQYAQMLFARGPLKFSLIVTLSLISLASLLFSMLTAIYLSRRLVAPISNLAAGTQKIAEGDYGSHLPVTTTDELGILTKSFNNMSSKINDAQQAAQASQTETEQQKGYLEAVLTNLSSGVFSFDQDKRLQICNSAATDILGLDRSTTLGKTLPELVANYGHTTQFFEVIESGIASGQATWQDEITLLGKHGRQILIIRGSLLHGEHGSMQMHQSNQVEYDNHVIVFDDVTNLIQAQRDAAWGEVARRLAHEIKNPLTPIQLSAERIKSKLSDHVSDELQETLDRATRTIVQQVESMKEMVNAFSSYAQPVRAKLRTLDINQLVRDVVELHTSSLTSIDIELDLDDSLPAIKANGSALRQVLNNLVINASHALEDVPAAKLRIRTHIAAKITGQYIDLVVEDNGSGIPEEIRESLFDPYVSSKAKGSGLGLAIVKRIVEEHSGSVWTRQSSLGGAAMHMRLPINAMQTYRGNRNQNTLQSDESTNSDIDHDKPSLIG
ncbi:sensor histidine kinase [Arenicella xantha]|uniref:histidine kinase n=1 Tax=Arenicella xantha TaxID=644221 RepID=A0A395JH17_9GAMM|nr:ATP-binding protein [Arenicella xantha]RBP48829.1 nitrogen fixation/metabolism regulation signal transduction histidine kinase [Arenicella xantha]